MKKFLTLILISLILYCGINFVKSPHKINETQSTIDPLILVNYKNSLDDSEINLVNFNGFQVLEYFRNNNLFDLIPVSIITGVGDDELVAKAFNYPIVDVLRKPFNERDIKEVVEKTVQYAH